MYNKLTEKDRNIFVDGRDIIEFSMYDEYGLPDYDYYDYYGLVLSLCNENQGEIRYIKELVSRKIDCNFPLLICNCDLDLKFELNEYQEFFCGESI